MTRTSPRRRRILVLDPFPPRLDAHHGGARTTAEFLLVLAARHDVSLICLREGSEPHADPQLSRSGVEVAEIARPAPRWLPLARGLARGRPSWVTAWDVAEFRTAVTDRVAAWRPDLVQVDFHVMGQYLDAVQLGGTPTVLVSHEPGADALASAWRSTPWRGLPLLALEWLAWRRYERLLYSSLDAVVAFTERDRRSIARLAPRTLTRTIAPSIRLPSRPADPAGTGAADILFFGSFRHPPNRDAADLLVRRIFPLVRRRLPAATLTIAGERPSPRLLRAANESVRILGAVEDLDPLLDAAAVVAVPLRSGGGVRIKVLHALAAGKAVVASSLASEGIAEREPPPMVIADDEKVFASGVARLLEERDRRIALAREARAWAVANVGWDAVMDRYDQLYEALLPDTSLRTRHDQ